MHKKKMATGAGDISLPDVSKLNDLKDEQIEALIEKLAEVQAHAPQIIAALEAQQEARSRGSKSQGSKGDRQAQRIQPSPSKQRSQSPTRQQQQYIEEEVIEEEEEEEEEGEDEDYDDFDEDAEYPMVGDGYSDELSVVSDMTTPTVVSSMEINEEEYYKDMVIGGMKFTAPKKKDLLSQVSKVNARKIPGAAAGVAAGGVGIAAPKKKVASAAVVTAEKKTSRAATNYSAVEATAVAPAVTTKKKKSKDGKVSTATGTKKVKKKSVKKAAPPNGASSGWDAANGAGPSTTEKRKKPQEKKSGPVMIDDDGFLVDQSTFETFDSTNNPFASPPSFTADPLSDDGFAGFADFGTPAPAPAPRKAASKPKKLNVASTGKKKSSGSSQTGSNSPKQTKRKGPRRASVGVS